MASPTFSSGLVVLFMSDVEGSTAMWDHEPDAMAEAIRIHDALFARILPEFNGELIKDRGEGDSHFGIFSKAGDALKASIAIQQGLARQEWPTAKPIRTRMALHIGEAELRESDFYGQAVNRCGRLRSAGHGGQILVSNAFEQLVRDKIGEEAGLLDLGAHRLRDLSRPEHVFQVTHSELPRRFPALRSLDVRPNNLPIQLTTFIGREAEAARTGELMRQARLLTLTGAGGSGKTRLALAAAAESIDEFPDGVWFVDLAPLTSESHAAPHIAQTLGLSVSGSVSTSDALATYAADAKALILLDNCEHVLSTVSSIAADLLAAGHGVKILATSRQTLAIPGEQNYVVPGMALATKTERGYIARLLASDAGSLFLERSRAVDPDFQVNRSNAEAVGDICRKLDGMPLAIELAASRIRVMSPEQIRDRLQDRFKLLSSGQSGADRHKTLRATVDWSYGLLNEDEVHLFECLSVFRGGFGLEMAEYVCGSVSETPVMDVIQSLVERSMVVREHGRSNEARFRLLETLREYADEKLTGTGVEEILAQRLFSWCEKLTEDLSDPTHRLPTPKRLDRIEEDFDNLRHAIEWAMETQEPHAVAEGRLLSLLYRLSSYWIQRGGTGQARQWLARALERDPAADPPLRARCLNLSAILAMRENDLETALSTYRACIPIWRELSDHTGLAATMSNIGMAEMACENQPAARAALEESVALFRSEELRERLGNALLTLGWVLQVGNDLTASRTALEEGLEISLARNDFSGISTAFTNLAGLETAEGRLDLALEHIVPAIEAGEDARDVYAVHFALMALGRLLKELGQCSFATEALGAAMRIWEELKTPISPFERRRLEQLSATLTAELGAEEFENRYQEGRSRGGESGTVWAKELVRTLT